MQYLCDIWKSRYFWLNLSLSDLRNRWRRSFFGVFWAVLQPLGLTVLLSVVLSNLFQTDITTFAPYILSGIIIWDCLVSTVTGGSLTFVQADAYIKQCKHPLAIYSLRTTLTNMMVLVLASLALLGWAGVALPKNFGWCWLSVLTIYPILLLILWPLATSLAYIGARFRDLPHASSLILQAVWFVSPVYFTVEMFQRGNLEFLIKYNPIYHILQIVRAPLLQGQWPTLENYTYALICALVFTICAIVIGRKAEQKIIFYL